MKSFIQIMLFASASALQLDSTREPRRQGLSQQGGMTEEEAKEIMAEYNFDGDASTWTKGEAALSYFTEF